MKNAIVIERCRRCGVALAGVAAVCGCLVGHAEAHTEQIPLSPQVIQPTVLQTSTSMSSEEVYYVRHLK
jgi:hypothetical protein